MEIFTDFGIDAALDKGQQRQNATFAVVVGAQHQLHVFDRNHQHQRPENERDDAFDVGRRRHRVAGGVERDRERVEWTGADIAEHHAKRGQGQKADASGVVAGRVPCRLWRGARRCWVRGRGDRRPPVCVRWMARQDSRQRGKAFGREKWWPDVSGLFLLTVR